MFLRKRRLARHYLLQLGKRGDRLVRVQKKPKPRSRARLQADAAKRQIAAEKAAREAAMAGTLAAEMLKVGAL